MAYIHATREFMEDKHCMDAINKAGIKLEPMHPVSFPDAYCYKVTGDKVPKTDNQVVILIDSDKNVAVEQV